MFRIITFFILITLLSLGFVWLDENQGDISMIWLGYEVVFSTSFLFAAIISIAAMFTLVYLVFSKVVGSPREFRDKIRDKRYKKSVQIFQNAYAALLSGDVENAKLYSNKVKGFLVQDDTIQNFNHVLVGKIAQEEGNFKLSNTHFEKLLEKKNTKFVGIKGLLDNAFFQGDLRKAAELAREAYELNPNVKNGAKSLLVLYKKAKMWASAELFLNSYKRRFLFRKDHNNDIDIRKELIEVYICRANDLFEKAGDSEYEAGKALEYLNKVRRLDKNNPDIIDLYVDICIKLRKDRNAKKFIEEIWKDEPSYDLGQKYINIEVEHKRKVKAAEKLISINPKNPISEKLYDEYSYAMG
jgi:HemY protein